MSTDRELLELAAKAAGLGDDVDAEGGGVWIKPDGFWRLWNPLTDDGDAFRLAVSLGLLVDAEPERAYVSSEISSLDEPARCDLYAATRRAIVRAAAEIGRSLP